MSSLRPFSRSVCWSTAGCCGGRLQIRQQCRIAAQHGRAFLDECGRDHDRQPDHEEHDREGGHPAGQPHAVREREDDLVPDPARDQVDPEDLPE
jgi:hypothetical protein